MYYLVTGIVCLLIGFVAGWIYKSKIIAKANKIVDKAKEVVNK